MRKIIHIDMDAFYAAVEQRDNPDLQGRAVAVGGSSQRGVIAAASYEAREYGIHSAMPTARALQLCPDLVLVRPRFDAYRDVSRQIRQILGDYTNLIEPLSLDEAYLDVTKPKQGPPSATLIAREIRAAIQEASGLTASAGVSYNKFLAKTASDVDKPDGLTVIRPEDAAEFIAGLAIERFRGVGPVTAEKMHELDIHTGEDLRGMDEEQLRRHFGKSGAHFYRIVRGKDDRPVVTDRERKSVGAERTFATNARTLEKLNRRLEPIAERVARRLSDRELSGHTVTLKVKYSDFDQRTRSRTFDHTVREAAELYTAGRLLLQSPGLPDKPVRLLGLTVTSLKGADTPKQLSFDFTLVP